MSYFSISESPVQDCEKNHKVAATWAASAAQLASWARDRLVNRADAYGSYLPLDRREPQKNAITRKRELTNSVLERHFARVRMSVIWSARIQLAAPRMAGVRRAGWASISIVTT